MTSELPEFPAYVSDALREYADLQDMVATSGGTFPVQLNGRYTGASLRTWADEIDASASHAVTRAAQPTGLTEGERTGTPWTVLSALDRFSATCEDDESTDLPRPILDALVAFGYLCKPKRGYWEMTPAGEAALTPPVGEPLKAGICAAEDTFLRFRPLGCPIVPCKSHAATEPHNRPLTTAAEVRQAQAEGLRVEWRMPLAANAQPERPCTGLTHPTEGLTWTTTRKL